MYETGERDVTKGREGGRTERGECEGEKRRSHKKESVSGRYLIALHVALSSAGDESWA